MRVHEAFWIYIAENGTKGGKAHVRKRTVEGPHDDTRWLLSRAGVKARKVWKTLPPEERASYVNANQDANYPTMETLGVFDERTILKECGPTQADVSSPSHLKNDHFVVSTNGADSSYRESTPPEVSACEKTRKRWLDAAFYAAVAQAQVVSIDAPPQFVNASAIKKVLNVGTARAMMTLPPEYREEMQRAMSGVVSMVSAIPGAVMVSTRDELQEDSKVLTDALTRAEHAYCKSAKRAIKVCKERCLPDPDPYIEAVPKPANHPDYVISDEEGDARDEHEDGDDEELYAEERSKAAADAAEAEEDLERKVSAFASALDAVRTQIGKRTNAARNGHVDRSESNCDLAHQLAVNEMKTKEAEQRYAADKNIVKASLNTALDVGEYQASLIHFNGRIWSNRSTNMTVAKAVKRITGKP